jgi:predicted 3-demethylubiquinone-9 3-methyltransferase (glyoxalase superfamily)
MKGISPFLWFDSEAEEAANYYVSIFPNSEIKQISHYAENMPKPAGSVLTVGFTLNGEPYTALNGGPQFKFNEAVSLVVHCEDQAEIDYYWDKLVEGGSSMACGWLKDRYGLCWQIVPVQFFDMISDEGSEQAARVLAAMNTMIKFDLAALEKAYRGE